MSSTTAADLDERLYRLLQLVNDWLKFAEAKNVAMIGFASGAIAVVLGFLQGFNMTLPVVAGLALAIGEFGLLLTLLVSLASFLPQTNEGRIAASRISHAQAGDNLYYYGHVARYAPQDLVEEILSRHLAGDVSQIDAGHLDLAGQIVVNARITLRKLRLFTLSVACFAVGVVASSAGVLIAAVQP